MSRLINKMREHIAVNGMAGKADLCKAANRGMRSVETWLAGKPVPETLRYKLALACGCTHEEALELAQEGPQSHGKASA